MESFNYLQIATFKSNSTQEISPSNQISPLQSTFSGRVDTVLHKGPASLRLTEHSVPRSHTLDTDRLSPLRGNQVLKVATQPGTGKSIFRLTARTTREQQQFAASCSHTQVQTQLVAPGLTVSHIIVNAPQGQDTRIAYQDQPGSQTNIIIRLT